MSAGPLSGLKVVEFTGIGPGPMCGMLLADLGAQVLRIDRVTPSDAGIARPPRFDLLHRGKRAICIDLKQTAGVTLARSLVTRADALIEGFRPGAMERMGLGPDVCIDLNPRLVYGRVTGFGQTGPLAQCAGHDLNYIALSGVLHGIGRCGAAPTPPLNLVGDYAGGALLLAFGIVSALLCARDTGCGQVVDAAMIDGSASMMTSLYGLLAAGLHNGPRGTNLLDSGAPHYEVYRCADGEFVSVAPLERKFQQVLAERLQLHDLPDFGDRAGWLSAKQRMGAIFAQRTRAQWCELLEGTDACFAPVLSPNEAPQHPHHRARATFIEIDGITQPAPVPRFSATPAARPEPPQSVGTDGLTWAADWGVPQGELLAAFDSTH
jgi:alpha-methylacyl-CoA racemase